MAEREHVFRHPSGTDPDTGERFLFFWRTESPFSQWHESRFTHRDETFFTAEQWMMAGKARLFGDETTRAKILATHDPRQQKALGRKVRNFDADRWTAHSFGVVYLGNWLKFAPASGLHGRLKETAAFTLVEASPLDTIWGIGLAAEDDDAIYRSRWRGENRLGKVLTELREDFVAQRADARAKAFFDETGV